MSRGSAILARSLGPSQFRRRYNLFVLGSGFTVGRFVRVWREVLDSEAGAYTRYRNTTSIVRPGHSGALSVHGPVPARWFSSGRVSAKM